VVIDNAGGRGPGPVANENIPNPICSSEGDTESCPQGMICARHGNLPLACRRICEEHSACAAGEQCLGAARINRRICVPQ
jgi:hypothetical protein